ncbi:MAG: ATP synthase F1 subunit delta [Candidatus Eremiobacteraeota bacterium]|nr:ATP synthase F1 subunit delta [Candidatus Eremiobacteraeota bacterium]
MKGESIAEHYSQALLEIAKEKDKVDEYFDELRYVKENLLTFKRLNHIIKNPGVAAHVKKEILRELFGDRISPDVLHFIFLIIDKNRELYLEKTIDRYMEKVFDSKNIIQADVVMSNFPPLDFVEKIREKIFESTGKKAELTLSRDPNLIGGFQIIIKDRIIDYSIRGQLEKIKQELHSLPITDVG